MKNQYFGDNRDLFKYDLIFDVIQKTDSVNRFTFIPMLTKNENTKHGEDRDRDKAKAGINNKDLVGFLNKFDDRSKRDIRQLEPFFKRHNTEITIYKAGEYFSDEQRDSYFNQIAHELPPKSVILVDPDTGLEVNKSGKEHILYCEVKKLYDNMDKHSVLMIFQWISRFVPRVERSKYLRVKSQTLRDKVTKNLSIIVSDGKIAFFFLAKDKSVIKSLSKVIGDYKQSYPQLK